MYVDGQKELEAKHLQKISSLDLPLFLNDTEQIKQIKLKTILLPNFICLI